MALKDYPTSELLAEVMRREKACPRCMVLRIELAEVARVLGPVRMADANGYHYEAAKAVVRELDRALTELERRKREAADLLAEIHGDQIKRGAK